jgi:hypothetical protein
MRYMLMICTDENADMARNSDEQGAAKTMQEYDAFNDEMGRRGVLRSGARLRPDRRPDHRSRARGRDAHRPMALSPRRKSRSASSIWSTART